MIAYIKLTDINGRTHGETQWAQGVRHQCADPHWPLVPCTPGAIHCYAGNTEEEALALAAFMNPAHGGYGCPRAWRCEPEGEVIDGGDKAICRALTVLEEVTLPKLTLEQRVEFAIRATLMIDQPAEYVDWAEGWLSGADRSVEAVEVVWRIARERMAEWDAAEEARRAAWRASMIIGRTGVRWMARDAAECAAAAAKRAAAEAVPVILPLASLALAVIEGRGAEFVDNLEDRSA